MQGFSTDCNPRFTISTRLAVFHVINHCVQPGRCLTASTFSIPLTTGKARLVDDNYLGGSTTTILAG